MYVYIIICIYIYMCALYPISHNQPFLLVLSRDSSISTEAQEVVFAPGVADSLLPIFQLVLLSLGTLEWKSRTISFCCDDAFSMRFLCVFYVMKMEKKKMLMIRVLRMIQILRIQVSMIYFTTIANMCPPIIEHQC